MRDIPQKVLQNTLLSLDASANVASSEEVLPVPFDYK